MFYESESAFVASTASAAISAGMDEKCADALDVRAYEKEPSDSSFDANERRGEKGTWLTSCTHSWSSSSFASGLLSGSLVVWIKE
jgi:hypothetical protein